MRGLLRKVSVGLSIAVALGPLASALESSSDYYSKTQFPESVSPGQTITIAHEFDKTKGDITVKLFLVGSTTAQQIATGSLSADSHSVSVELSDKLRSGRYYATVDYGGLKDEVVPGEIRVQTNAVQLDSAYPTTAYRNDRGTFDFEILGRSFSSTDAANNRVYVSGQGQIINSWSLTEKGCLDSSSFPCLWVESEERLRVIGYKNERYQGPLMLTVRVGSSQSGEKPLVLARVSETGVVILSIALFAALGFIIYRIVARGMRDNVIDGETYSPFWSFFIDKETNSYSLSKFQLLLFASVFVFAYLYVFLCIWLVQWHFVLPDVPSTLGGILGLSAGTTVVAAAVTSARGSKGAGPVRPSAADFISSGGQVIPERFQFFVWTIVACIGFVALLVSQNPATIKEFPTFPQGLLYVMGVSATAYLGGKLARSPGPVIRNIAWDQANKEITIQGESLSSDADFFVDGTKLPIDPQAKDSLVTATPQDGASDKTFCSKLKIKINPIAGVDLSTGDHLFRITNKDAQFSESRFTADPPAISKVEMFSGGAVASGKDAIAVKVSGSGFKLGTTVQWTPPGAKDPIELNASAVEFIDSKTLKVSFVPGDRGIGTLRISTPGGFATVTTVAVS